MPTTLLVRELPMDLELKAGNHSQPDVGMCVMEAASYVAGEDFSDHPQCVCPVIAAFLRRWNDDLPDNESRTRLLAPLIPKIIGTRSTPEAELARVMLIVDWFVREHLPAWLELTPALLPNAEALRAIKPIQNWADFDAATKAIYGARDSAAAARAAAWDATGAAAWDAAGAAAWAAAWDATGAAAWAAAWDAARDAAWDATGAAAWAAAWDATGAAAWDATGAAAWAAVSPTKKKLQLSAVALVERMAAVK